MVRLMPGSQMEAVVSAHLDSGDSSEWLELMMMNLMQVSTIPNGYYHQGVMLLTAAYYNPALISGSFFRGESRRFLKDARKLREGFLSWYREAEKERELLYEDTDEADLRRLEAEKVLEGGE